MQKKISIILIIVGLAISFAALLLINGQGKVVTTTLGLIIAAGGCLMLLTSFKEAQQHRTFNILIAILFIVVIIGFIFKSIFN